MATQVFEVDGDVSYLEIMISVFAIISLDHYMSAVYYDQSLLSPLSTLLSRNYIKAVLT